MKDSMKKVLAVSETDQMNTIIKLLGVPSVDDLSFLTDPKRKAFMLTYESYSGKKLNTLFPDESEECLHLVRKMLEFNPYCRYSAEDCLSHPYFASVRNIELETK